MTLLIGLLAKVVGEKFAPFAAVGLLMAVAGGIWLSGNLAGRSAAALKAERKLNNAIIEQQEAYFDRVDKLSDIHAEALAKVTEARGDAPQIIREIRDAPVTACSGEPIGRERLRLLNLAITGSRTLNSRSTRDIERALAGS